jgi:hypothetical protein
MTPWSYRPHGGPATHVGRRVVAVGTDVVAVDDVAVCSAGHLQIDRDR